MPGGSASRRHREQTPEQSSPAAGPGGASLFTPAYRVSHAVAGTRPVSQDESGPGSPARPNSRYGRAGDLPGPGYAWADSEPGPPGTGYQQSGYGPGGGGPAWPGDDLAAGYSWAAYDQAAGAWPGSGVAGRGVPPQPRSNAVRGFPPAPGEPLPVYPPGPFAAWNRSPADPAGQEGGSRAGGYSESSRQLAAATITPDDFDTDYSLPAIKDPVPAKAGGDAAGRTAADRTAAGRRPAGGPGQYQPRAPHRGGRAGSKGRTTRTRRKRLSAWLASATAAVIIAAVALILVQTSPGSGAPSAHQNPTSTPGPAGPSPTPPPGVWEYIGSRKTDPVPLSLPELFPATITNQGTVYTRAKQAKGQNCHATLIGSALQTAVRRAGCTQALRATYLSKTAKVMATIGVFNLKSFALATKAAAKAGHSEFVAQLPAKAGPTKAIGQGTGIEEAVVKGHYLVLVWAEATDLSAPPRTKAGRARFGAFMSLLINHTVNMPLSTRMVDGKPARRG